VTNGAATESWKGRANDREGATDPTVISSITVQNHAIAADLGAVLTGKPLRACEFL
jgi:hypothetical protein